MVAAGLTVTVTWNAEPEQPLKEGVTVYVAVCATEVACLWISIAVYSWIRYHIIISL